MSDSGLSQTEPLRCRLEHKGFIWNLTLGNTSKGVRSGDRREDRQRVCAQYLELNFLESSEGLGCGLPWVPLTFIRGALSCYVAAFGDRASKGVMQVKGGHWAGL